MLRMTPLKRCDYMNNKRKKHTKSLQPTDIPVCTIATPTHMLTVILIIC